MKINIDSTWHKIIDVESDKVLIALSDFAFNILIRKILNNSQQLRLNNCDGIYTLSKKATKILLDEIELNKITK